MRSRARTMFGVTVVLAALVLTLSPGSAATTAYEMFGGGNLTKTGGPGLGFTGAPTTSYYTFATLPIVGTGVLVGKTTAAVYNCPSTVKITGVGLNFTINWTFTCTKTNGAGWPTIKGYFSGKFPIFKGTFSPYQGSVKKGTVKSTCTGVAIPTQVTGGRIIKMTFAGECTAPV